MGVGSSVGGQEAGLVQQDQTVFSRICLNFCMWASLYSRSIVLYFFRWFALRLLGNTYAKKQVFPGGVFLRSFVEREAKEIFCLSEQSKQRSAVVCSVLISMGYIINFDTKEERPAFSTCICKASVT